MTRLPTYPLAAIALVTGGVSLAAGARLSAVA